MNYIITLETDGPDDEYGVEGIRHPECLDRTDIFFATYLRDASPSDMEEHAYECWGCDGWLNKPSLSIEETVALHKSREDEE